MVKAIIFECGKKYKVISKDKYIQDKYGKDPIFILEDVDTELWKGGWNANFSTNIACALYAHRAHDLPKAGNVYYGKINHNGELLHQTEIGEEINETKNEKAVSGV